MTDRHTVDSINSDQLDQLYDDLAAARQELQQHAEADSADAAAGSDAGRVEEVAAERDLLARTIAATSKQTVAQVLADTRTALGHEGRAIAQPGRWLHVAFTSPDETTANTSALNLADHLAAEFPGVGMRITTNAVEAGPLTTTEEARLAQTGIDTPGCDCGHDGMGESWHGDTCDWKSIPPCDVCGVRGHSFEDCDESTAPELTAEEARDLADELGTELYKAQDALAFVEECCVIADREQRAVTTADVRKWLKGAQCGRQLAADGELDDTGLTEADVDRMMATGIPVHIVTAPLTWTTAQQFYEPAEDPAAVQARFEAGEKGITARPVPRFTYHPVTPEMEREATARAEQAAADSERSAAWFAATGGVIGGAATGPEEPPRTTPDNSPTSGDMPDNPLEEQLRAAIESELYEYRERTMWWPEGAITGEIARLATRGAMEVLEQQP